VSRPPTVHILSTILDWRQYVAMHARAAARRDVGVVPAIVTGNVFLEGSECVYPLCADPCTAMRRHKASMLPLHSSDTMNLPAQQRKQARASTT
jgi:hypothetical protein